MCQMDVSDVGQGKTHNEAVEKYDAEHGKYDDSRVKGAKIEPGRVKPAAKTIDPFTLHGGSGE
jgi:hypothetical protein